MLQWLLSAQISLARKNEYGTLGTFAHRHNGRIRKALVERGKRVQIAGVQYCCIRSVCEEVVA